MIIPSIDISQGNAVQLVGGRSKVLDAGDPLEIAKTFSLVGEIAVVDLDAAMGNGTNEELIRKLIEIAPCRVGGGIRDVDTAIKWLDAGASKVMLGTAATPEVISQLPRNRVVVALDAHNDEVVIKGWKERTGKTIKEKLLELHSLADNFLITFVELEGRMQGTSLERAALLSALARSLSSSPHPRLTIAGGITTADEVAALDKLGADAQIGMALYTGTLPLAQALCAVLRSDRADGLWPTVVTDEYGLSLGLAWSNSESVTEALACRRGVYYSRERGLWEKGKTSGNWQELCKIRVDCDRDALCFVVKQHGSGFCHQGTRSCWEEQHEGIVNLWRRLSQRLGDAPLGSYTKRLLDDPFLLNQKLIEEASELAQARTREEIIHEASDVLYFTLTALARAQIELSEVEKTLARRALRVTRREEKSKRD